MAEELTWGQRNIGVPLRNFFQPVGDTLRSTLQPVGDVGRAVGAEFKENGPRFVLGAPEQKPAAPAAPVPPQLASRVAEAEAAKTSFLDTAGRAVNRAAQFSDQAVGQVAQVLPSLAGYGLDLVGTVATPFSPTFAAAMEQASDMQYNRAREWSEAGLAQSLLYGSTPEQLAAEPANFVPVPGVADAALAAQNPATTAPKPAVAVDVSSAFGSALPAGTTARGGLSFSPITEYTPEQQRVFALSRALEGIPALQLGQLMQAMPQRPDSPSMQDIARENYFDLAMNDYLAAMQTATSREEQEAARQLLGERLVMTFGGNSIVAP